MQDHLTVAPQPPESAETEVRKVARAAAKAKTSRPLPTDRMKFDLQVSTLRAICTESRYGKTAVGGEDIASRLAISAATASLNNTFFVEAGLITREGKGRYKPVEAANKFARDWGFDPVKAGRHLAEPLKASWYFQEVGQQIAFGPTTTEQMLQSLAHSAGTDANRRQQLSMVLSWLEFAALIDMSGGVVRLLTEVDESESDDAAPEGDSTPKDLTERPPAGTEGKTTTTAEGRSKRPQADAILNLSFDFALTAQDLAQLSPEQIREVFEAVGKVAAIKADLPA